MPFLKNLQFTKLIKIDGHLREFNFRKSNANIDTAITIDACGDDNIRICFNMKLVNNNWQFCQQDLPQWIYQHENGIKEAIQQEMETQDIYMMIPSHPSNQFSRLLEVFRFN